MSDLNSAPIREVVIRDESIRLGQLLKLANFVSSGSDVKYMLASEEVSVNGEVETRRGRTLHPSDLVSVGKISVRVIKDSDSAPPNGI